jgi:hypothetical protein
MDVEFYKLLFLIIMTTSFTGIACGTIIMVAAHWHRNIVVATIGFILLFAALAVATPVTTVVSNNVVGGKPWWLSIVITLWGFMALVGYVNLCRLAYEEKKKASEPSEATAADADSVA